MRRMLTPGVVVLLPLIVAACATASVAPEQFRVLSPVPVKTAYSCVQALVDSLGYTVTSSDRASGFLASQRLNNAGTGWDMLTVSLLKQADGRTELHVTAASDFRAVGKDGEQRISVPPSESVTFQAGEVLTHCGGPNGVPEATTDSIGRQIDSTSH